jgi:hypothetical protein
MKVSGSDFNSGSLGNFHLVSIWEHLGMGAQRIITKGKEQLFPVVKGKSPIDIF